jgi:hypothetical protein
MNIPHTVDELDSYESWLKENGATIHVSAPAGAEGQAADSYARGLLIEDYMVAKYRSIPRDLPPVPDGCIVKEILRSPSWETTLILRPEVAESWWAGVTDNHEYIVQWGEKCVKGKRSGNITAEALRREIDAGTI